MKLKFIILIIAIGFVSAKDAGIIKINQPGKIVIEVSIDSTWISEDKQTIHTLPILDAFYEPGLPIIPYYHELFYGIPADANVSIFNNDKELIGTIKPYIVGPETAEGIDFTLPVENQFDGIFPKHSVKITPLREINNIPTSKIEIFPFLISDNQLFATKNISVQITWDINAQHLPPQRLSSVPLNELNTKRMLNKPSKNIIPQYQFNNNIAKIIVEENGWYKITNAELIAKGIDLLDIAPNRIHLWNKSNEIPIYVDSGNDGNFNNQDMIVFYGERNPPPLGADYDYNLYMYENVYWLTWGSGAGLRFEEEDVSAILPDVQKPEYFIDTLKIEQNDHYRRIKYNNSYTLQNWDVVDHIISATNILPDDTTNIAFNLYDPVDSITGIFSIELLLNGLVYTIHDVSIGMNENDLFDVTWYGQKRFLASNDQIGLFSNILQHGKNKLSLVASKNNPNANDLIKFDWFKIFYPRYYRAINNALEFEHNTNEHQAIQFEIQNVSSTEVLLFKNKKKLLKNYNISLNTAENNYTVSFQDRPFDSKYDLLVKDSLKSIKNLFLEKPIRKIVSDVQNKYITICPDSFKTILKPLLDIHDGAAISVDDIYRQYNGGVMSPYAIKRFISDLYYHNNLEFVLISMQNSRNFNPRSFLTRPAFIPSMHVMVENWGDVASDYWYSLLEGDDYIADIAIGRFPAANREVLKVMVDKTVEYLERDYEQWDNNTLLIGGAENVFTIQSEMLATKIIDKGSFLSRIYVGTDPSSNYYYSNTDTLLSHFERGLSYVNFVGHGGGYVWSDSLLISKNEIENDLIRNGNRTPFVTSMTCYTGDYSNIKSLGRYMLSNPYGGAVAWFGSAGPGWRQNDFYLVNPIQDLLFSDEDLTVGELINKAKTLYYLEYSKLYSKIDESMLYQFNLIGDPALKLKKPQKEQILIAPLDPEPGGTIVLSTNNTSADSVYYQLFLPDNNSQNHPKLLSNSLPANITLADTLDQGLHRLNVSYKSNDIVVNSSQLLSISGSYANILPTIPSIPTSCDSIQIIAEVEDHNGIGKVKLFVNGEYWSDMELLEDRKYSATKLIPPHPVGTSLNLVCEVIDANNKATQGMPKVVKINDIPNVVPKQSYMAVDEAINIVIDVENTTSTATETYVELLVNKNDQWQLFGKDTVWIEGNSKTEVKFPGYFPNGSNSFKMISTANTFCVQEDFLTDDTVAFNIETNAFWITPELGSTNDGISHSVVGTSKLQVDIPPGLVRGNDIIQFKSSNEANLSYQPDFQLNQSSITHPYISISTLGEVDYEVKWNIGSTAINLKDKLYKYVDEIHIWLPVEYNVVSDSTISFMGSGSDKFAFLTNIDNEKPILNAHVNKQPFYSETYINSNPIIEFTAYDKNGIDARVDSVLFWINGSEISNAFTDIRGSGSTIKFSINPTLSEQDSTISLLIKDAAGNSSDTLSLAFNISNNLELFDYGNYPNPFSQSTIIAYELTEAVDKITIDIFTAKGRRIKSLKQELILSTTGSKGAGYHEVSWNGRNDAGKKVGNGIYFYLMKVKKDKKSIERIGKMMVSR